MNSVEDNSFQVEMSENRDKENRPARGAYSVWKVSPLRFAVTRGQQFAPVIGYAVTHTGNGGWTIERKGSSAIRPTASLNNSTPLRIDLASKHVVNVFTPPEPK